MSGWKPRTWQSGGTAYTGESTHLYGGPGAMQGSATCVIAPCGVRVTASVRLSVHSPGCAFTRNRWRRERPGRMTHTALTTAIDRAATVTRGWDRGLTDRGVQSSAGTLNRVCGALVAI